MNIEHTTTPTSSFSRPRVPTHFNNYTSPSDGRIERERESMEEKRKKALSSTEVVMSGDSNSRMKAAETILRVVPMGLCLAALLIMIKNAESNDYGSVSYYNLGGFKYQPTLTHVKQTSLIMSYFRTPFKFVFVLSCLFVVR